MAAKKNLSVAEMIAQCRQADGDGSGGAVPEASAAAQETTEQAAASAASKKPGEMSVAEMLAAARGEKANQPSSAEPAEAAPAPAATPKKVDPGKMSVADMLAAARAEKTAGSAAAKSKPAAAKAKPAAKPAKDKASPKPVPTGPKDTSSILAAARKSVKPGPMSKAEAAEKAGTDPKGKPKIVAPPMPEKPSYAVTKARTAAAAKSDRRGFIEVLFGSSLALGFSSLAAISGLWSLGLARYMFPNILTEPPSRFKVGFPEDFAPGFVATKFKAQFGIWIVNTVYEGQSQIVALKAVCTHLGCTPNWLEGEQKFKCPCHGSGFYIDGINFEGPAPRPLERYAIRVADDGQIEVDKSKKFQQELGQWSNSSSFVAV